MKKELKTPEHTLKAIDDRDKSNGYIQFNRRIKPEWKAALDKLLAKLRKGIKDNQDAK